MNQSTLSFFSPIQYRTHPVFIVLTLHLSNSLCIYRTVLTLRFDEPPRERGEKKKGGGFPV